MSESECGCSPTCCSDKTSTKVIDAVRTQYAATARSALTNDSKGVQAVAEAFGYSVAELTSIPAEANMGLSCGNPTATAHLKPGEVVVDLGSGGGLDVFLAAQKVGPTGKAIGIDMTPEMVDRAKRAAEKGVDGKPFPNVEFHLSTIDRLPIESASVDVIVSNCVINLAPDKPAVFREMFRVLKPGGRVAVSDIALKKVLPGELANDISAFVGCIAGAILIEDYRSALGAAGFAHVTIVDAKSDLNAYGKVEGQSACCSPSPAASEPCCSTGARSTSLQVTSSACCSSDSEAPTLGHETKAAVHDHLRDVLSRYDVNEYASSVKVFAIKPLL